MIDAEIIAEARRQFAWLGDHGNPKICMLRPDWQLPDVAWLGQTRGTPELQFMIDPMSNPEQIIVYVSQIGRLETLGRLPVGEFHGRYRLPERVLMDGDSFAEAYRTDPRAVPYYSIYRELTERLQPTTICEIGVRAGYSAYQLLAGTLYQGIKAENGATYAYLGIDQDEGQWGGVVGYIDHARHMLDREFPFAAMAIVVANSQDLHDLPMRYDLINIDGAHGHDETLHDLTLARRHTNTILIDDVKFIPTVSSALDEFLRQDKDVKGTFYDTWRGHVLLEWEA